MRSVNEQPISMLGQSHFCTFKHVIALFNLDGNIVPIYLTFLLDWHQMSQVKVGMIFNNSNHSYNTRNATQLRATITRTAYYYRSFTVFCLNLWNSFLIILKNVHLYQVLNGLSPTTLWLNYSFKCILSFYQFCLF